MSTIPALAQEFTLTKAELSFLQHPGQAYENLARTGVGCVSLALAAALAVGACAAQTSALAIIALVYLFAIGARWPYPPA